LTDALDPLPLLRALHEAGVRYIIVGGFAVNAHGYIRPSRDLDVCPDPEPGNLTRLAGLLASINARQIGLEDFEPSESPADPTRPEDLADGANFRLETDLGDLDVMQWLSGIESEMAYETLTPDAIEARVEGVPVRVCGLEHLRAMKAAAGRPRDLDDLEHLPEPS
jgi:hypothetical protein